MDGISPTRARHTLTHFESLHLSPKCNDRSSRGIAERHRLVEAVERRLRGVDQSLAAGFIDHLLDEIGTRTRLADQTLFGELNDHALGPGRDQTCLDFDKRLPLAWSWHGHVFYGGFPSFDVLKKLF